MTRLDALVVLRQSSSALAPLLPRFDPDPITRPNNPLAGLFQNELVATYVRSPATAGRPRGAWSKHMSGGGGTRTPMRLRAPHFECGALPVRATPPGCHLPRYNRGARIRTGDLCVPNAALYRTEPRPVRPRDARGNRQATHGRSGIRTHAGLHPHDFQSCALSRSAIRPEQPFRPKGRRRAEGVGFEPTWARSPTP